MGSVCYTLSYKTRHLMEARKENSLLLYQNYTKG